MDELRRLIASNSDRSLERAVFGTDDADKIVAAIVQWCSTLVGEPHEVLFYRRSSGVVVATRLVTGEAVVIKANQPHLDLPRLRASRRAQEVLHASGFPIPALLVPPTRLGVGYAAAEQFVPTEPVDVHDGAIRRQLAGRLAELIATLAEADLLREPIIGDGFWESTQSVGLWPIPHDPRFDFNRTGAGAEWIDEAATNAQSTLRAASEHRCVAHLDWRVENLAFQDSNLVGVYDIESIGKAPEAVAVGQASAAFTTDWSRGYSTMTTIDEMQAFVADYETARGRSFEAPARTLIEAANLMVIAYASRCEHSDRTLHPELAPPPGPGWVPLLRQRISQPLDW